MRTTEVVARLATGQAISGVRNCHLPNVNSYVLQDRQSEEVGMVRVFHTTEGHQLDRLFNSRGEFTVAPHNHRQDITLELLYGEVENLDYIANPPTFYRIPVHQMRYNPPLLGGDGKFERVRSSHITAPRATKLEEGTPYILRYHAVHGIHVLTNTAAWIVREGLLAPAGHDAVSYLQYPDYEPQDNLYVPLTPDELRDSTLEVVRALTI